MNISELRNTLIPKLKAFCNIPIIEADNIGPRPHGSHATFKFTNPYGKDVGRSVEVYEDGQMIRQDSYKTTISFNAYDLDDDVSRELAQKIYDWFDFFGEVDLMTANIAVVELTNVLNRDAFVVENYERRNGFDAIIRVSRELARAANEIERIETTGESKF